MYGPKNPVAPNIVALIPDVAYLEPPSQKCNSLVGY